MRSGTVQMQVSPWARRVWVISTGVLLAITIAAVNVHLFTVQTRLDAAERERTSIATELNEAEQEHEQRDEAQAEEAFGVDADRVLRDQERITALVDTALTWDSGVSYEEARGELIRRFQLDPRSGFLTVFMPEAAYSETDGKRFYELDAIGVNSAFTRVVSIQIVRVSAMSYEYAVVAEATMSTDANAMLDGEGQLDEGPTEQRRVLLHVVTDSEGRFTELDGEVSSGATRMSA